MVYHVHIKLHKGWLNPLDQELYICLDCVLHKALLNGLHYDLHDGLHDALHDYLHNNLHNDSHDSTTHE